MTAIRDMKSLLEAVGHGERPRYIFFWGHTGGGLGKHCLSQWYPSTFTLDGVTYPTAEHYMMAEKARLFGDDASLQLILDAPHPGAAKAQGRLVQGFDKATWEAHRSKIVQRANEAKFGQDDVLGRWLRGTGDRVLVEASPHDKIWGIGLAEHDDGVEDPYAWKGLNLLGFAIMAAREALQIKWRSSTP